ncbi:MAG TPA: hypothetical protein VMY76_05145 [Gemmatimonadales bacterium]|nr:hypothetical protein [Gemmatimonadales bacterium]
MTPVPGLHLTPDDIDAWLAGALAPAAQGHLDHCPDCQERAETEREITVLLGALPLLSPAAGFADRVMARVSVPAPHAVGTLDLLKQRILASRRNVAIAASLLVLLLGSMAGSVVWTLGHQETLAAFGGWLSAQAGQAAWLGVRGVASNFIEQPWFAALKSLAASPGRLGLASTLAMLTYVAGILAFRRLLALPTQQVAHAGI